MVLPGVGTVSEVTGRSGDTEFFYTFTSFLAPATVYRFDNQISLTPHVDTRWKRLYGDVESQVRQSYRYVPGLIDGFNINGTALDRNSVNISAGLDLAWSPQHTVGLTYSAENGTNSRSQGLMGQWQMRF